MKLNANEIKAMNEPGMHSDGMGLYLKITKDDTKSWIHRFKCNGRRRDMGLGLLKIISLAEARSLVIDNHKLIAKGIDPIDKRRESSNTRIPIFDECAEQVIASKRAGWNNPKSEGQWTTSLKTYASPVMGRVPVDQITTEHVLKVLTPIWATKNETASRVRSRIEIILNWAKVKGYFTGENPAVWRGHLEHLFAKPSKVKKVKHHEAMPYNSIAGFMTELTPKQSISAKALQFTILTACRTSEVTGASWDEIDMGNMTWTIPDERMKMDKPHTVPLSEQAIALLESLLNQTGWLFPSPHYGKHISNMSMLNLLKRSMGYSKLTVHGFRSTFRDWTANETSTQNHIAEMALAHSISSGAEKSYRRGDLLKKRAILMQAWANYCTDTSTVFNLKVASNA